jgi:hypothetical protein
VQPTLPSCKTDWTRCTDNEDLANNYSSYSRAHVACEHDATSRAKYGDPKFSWLSFGTFYVGDQYPKTGLAILIEKDAQYQNVFGAMVHSEVKCPMIFAPSARLRSKFCRISIRASRKRARSKGPRPFLMLIGTAPPQWDGTSSFCEGISPHPGPRRLDGAAPQSDRYHSVYAY